MSRVRGAPGEGLGASGWALLNPHLFGRREAGGYSQAIRPEVLPIDWDRLFGRPAPLTLEIGFNRGLFLEALAIAWPDHNHVGVEVRRRFAEGMAARVQRAGAPRNLRMIWGDAKIVLPSAFAPASLSALFVNFPDPWWKRRHHKRRLVDTDFAQTVADALAPGASVWIKSDVPMIAESIGAVLARQPRLTPPEPFEADALPTTHRERCCLRRGQAVVRYRMTKR